MPWQAWLTGLRRSDIIRFSTTTATTSVTYCNIDYGGGDLTTGANVTYDLSYITQYAQAMRQESYLAYEAMIHPSYSRQALAQQARAMDQAGLGQAGRREASKIEISTRAEALLVSSLNPEQTAEFRKRRQFTLHSKDGKRTYIITYGISGNVFEVERGQAIASYCIHPTGVPTEDVMLAQKLMLETDEESFLKIANRTSLRGLPNPRVLAA